MNEEVIFSIKKLCCVLIDNHCYKSDPTNCKLRGGDRKKERVGVGLKRIWGVLANQTRSQSRCARPWFPFRSKKKSPECNQEALCCNGWYDSDFPIFHSYSQADEKGTQQKKRNPQPPFQRACDPNWFILCIVFIRVGGRGSSLMLGTKHLPHHQQNGECKWANWLAPQYGEKHFT